MNGPLIGFLSALLFFIHPIQTQAVNYIWQRSTSLMALFYLAALIFYLTARIKCRSSYYFLSFFSAFIGMFCKENMITIVVTLILCEFFFFDRDDKLSLRVGRLLPFLALFLVTPLLLTRSGALTLDLMKPHISVSWSIFLLTELNVLRTYLRLLIWPLNLNIDYDYPLSRSFFDQGTLFSFLALVLILGTAVLLFKRNRLLSFVIFLFFLILSVEVLVPQADVIMEHRLYLPMAAFAIFIGANAAGLFAKNKSVALTIFMATGLIFSFLTYQRNSIWKDEYTLWNDALQKSPGKSRPYNNRGMASNDAGRIDSAIEDFKKAMSLDPGYAEVYCNLGIAYDQKDQLDTAITYYTRALKIKPRFAKVYNNRGVDYQLKGQYSIAISDLTKAIEMKPNYSEAYTNRGISQQLSGNLESAISDYSKAINLNPKNAEAYFNCGAAYLAKGDRAAALAHFDKALEIKPGFQQALRARQFVV